MIQEWFQKNCVKVLKQALAFWKFCLSLVLERVEWSILRSKVLKSESNIICLSWFFWQDASIKLKLRSPLINIKQLYEAFKRSSFKIPKFFLCLKIIFFSQERTTKKLPSSWKTEAALFPWGKLSFETDKNDERLNYFARSQDESFQMLWKLSRSQMTPKPCKTFVLLVSS